MTWVAATFILVAFLVLLQLLKVPTRAAEVVAKSRGALADLRSASLSDLEKERAMRAHSGRLFLLFFQITIAAAVALAVPIGLVWVLDRAGVVSLAATLDATTSWVFLGAATAFGLLFFWAVRRRR